MRSRQGSATGSSLGPDSGSASASISVLGPAGDDDGEEAELAAVDVALSQAMKNATKLSPATCNEVNDLTDELLSSAPVQLLNTLQDLVLPASSRRFYNSRESRITAEELERTAEQLLEHCDAMTKAQLTGEGEATGSIGQSGQIQMVNGRNRKAEVRGDNNPGKNLCHLPRPQSPTPRSFCSDPPCSGLMLIFRPFFFFS